MKKLYLCLVFFLGLLLSGNVSATPITYSGLFNTDNATVIASIGDMGDKTGYFWEIGDGITEAYDDTNLAWATGFDIDVYVPDNVLDEEMGWEFLINGTSIGVWSLDGSDGEGIFTFGYTFSSIYSVSDIFTIQMLVNDEVSPGYGSITLGKDMLFTLSGDTGTTVPEPATVLLFGLGIIGLAGVLRKK